jgi:diguanylate cyclase (GGDEF)-like protein/PAS domain S-box-containing protein
MADTGLMVSPVSDELEELEQVRAAASSGTLDAAFEDLPCIAMIEHQGAIIARNSLARSVTGIRDRTQPVEHVLVGAYDFVGRDRRFRFDCLLLRKDAPPMQVNAVTQGTTFDGEACRLLLMIERTQGFAGATDAESSFVEDVLDATPEATVIAHEGRILHVNREFSRLFGYTLAECAGQELDELVMPDGRRHESEMIYHMLEQAGRAEIETVRRTSSGELMDMFVLAARVRLGGEAHGMFVTYRDIRRQKKEQARLHYNAMHDGLTGLANRALFLERVELTVARLRRRPDRCFAVIFLDLDGFKAVNDTLGHAAGDALLLVVAQRLTRCLRPQDVVARFGGDEFALLLDESGGEDEVHGVAERIQTEVRRPICIENDGLDGVETRVSASMGIAMATLVYESADQILSHADEAMYAAKAAGKSTHVIYRS